MRNHELAQLIAFAFHQPDKMPDFEPSAPAEPGAEPREISDEADQARARGALIAMALASQRRTAPCNP